VPYDARSGSQGSRPAGPPPYPRVRRRLRGGPCPRPCRASQHAPSAAWLLPRPLGRLSGAGASPRLGIAAWLTAITSVLALALAALGLLARTAIDGWPAFARTVCESVTTGACPPAVYRSAAYELGLAITAFLGGITMVVLGWR
jgi:hypothetical protein